MRMGDVIRLDDHREARRPASHVTRLDHAVQRLDRLVHDRADRLTHTLERELASIARAVANGRAAEAADRAERLAGLLEHPAASGT